MSQLLYEIRWFFGKHSAPSFLKRWKPILKNPLEFISIKIEREQAYYRKGSKEAKAHIGFDVNRSIPKRIFLPDGKGPEGPFVCRIKCNTTKTCIKKNEVMPESIVFYDALVLLGTPGIKQTEKEVRLVGYRAGGRIYWVATDCHDLTAEQIALIYKLRWDIENFFAWWKRHLQVYHLIARSKHRLMIQILSGLIIKRSG